jgi:hypothetical protein
MSTRVNVPVDAKAKERDINAKLQLYGIYAGECILKMDLTTPN